MTKWWQHRNRRRREWRQAEQNLRSCRWWVFQHIAYKKEYLRTLDLLCPWDPWVLFRAVLLRPLDLRGPWDPLCPLDL